ncbi:MAG: hypothetical protein GXO90_02475, partial [FCB group bacterium]|nr:hypothetical protein [FCB group bacterium]
DCTDGGAEWIEVDLNGEHKKITFEYGDSLAAVQVLLDSMRVLRERFERGMFP